MLGSLLVVDGVVARIVEVEAYGGVGEDPGSHAHRRRGRRNDTMFERPGLLYVYFTYGMHWCANVVVHPPGSAGAVLLRAAHILVGESTVRQRRGDVPARDLARGPARMTRALGITGADDGTDLLAPDSRIRLIPGQAPPVIAVGPRVGVSGAGADTVWRWWAADDPAVSPYRRAPARRAQIATRGP